MHRMFRVGSYYKITHAQGIVKGYVINEDDTWIQVADSSYDTNGTPINKNFIVSYVPDSPFSGFSGGSSSSGQY